MANTDLLINVSEGEECRIALLENGRLEELYMERASATSHVGNIYKGRVTNVEPSIQAAFIDFGLGRNGFLHISDLMPTYFGRHGEDIRESVGRKMSRRDRPPIQRCLRRGDEIVVQIIKEGIGTKGPTLNTYLSIPGRILVMMPGMAKMGVSRKIEDDTERRRLRQILDSLKPPKDVGFIIRTAGIGKSKAEIMRDLNYLTRLWTTLVKKRDSGPGPMELYTEGDLVTRTVRDVVTSDVDRIIIDSKPVAARVKEVFKLANPRARNKVELYDEPVPLFHKFGIEAEIEQMYSRYVPLPSGGSLVIDSTEAVVAIDVNSGRSREHADAETSAFKTDLEAADEIPRQLRLRDLGGVIICDFIDLRYERHQRELERRLHENMQNDRAKTKILRMSQFGIIEMTRQRMRPSLKRSIYSDCPHCRGAGLVKTPESMGLDVMRRLRIAINDLRVARIELRISPDVAFFLQNRKRGPMAQLEEQSGKSIVVRADAGLGLDEMKLELFDTRDGLVYLEELGLVPPTPTGVPVVRTQGRSRFEQRRGQPQRQPPRGALPPPARADARDIETDDDHDMQSMEDEVERREEGVEEFERPSRDRDMPAEDGGEEHDAVASQSSTSAGSDRSDQAPAGERRMDEGGGSRRQGGQGGQGGFGESGERTGRPRRRRGRRGRGRNRGDNAVGPRESFGDQPAGPAQPGEQPQDDRDFPARGADEPSEQTRDEALDDIGPAPTEIESGGDEAGPPATHHRDSAASRRDTHDEGADRRDLELDRIEAADIHIEDEEPDLSGGNLKHPPEPRRSDVDGNSPQGRQGSRGRDSQSSRSHSGRGGSGGRGGAAGAAAVAGGEPMAGPADDSPAPRRRSRGGRGRRRGGGGGGGESNAGGTGGAGGSEPNGDAVDKSSSKPASSDISSATSTAPAVAVPQPPPEPRAAEAGDHTPTGSTDRHLAGDEPIAPQPVIRPRSYRDLDAIPDDDY
jgi:ribonuclease E